MSLEEDTKQQREESEKLRQKLEEIQKRQKAKSLESVVEQSLDKTVVKKPQLE